MQQLTPQDAVFLSMETNALPAHIGGLAFLNPSEGDGFSYDGFIDFIRERLGRCERFCWQLQEVPFGLDRPYWIRRDDFDPAEQVSRIAVPSPYSDELLSELTGMLFERPLDRTRPLWEMVLIEGLPGGRVALLWKIHHCLMDGASGANLSEQLFDTTPDAVRETPVELADSARGGRRVPAASLFDRALRNAVGLPARQRHYAGRAIKGLFRQLAAAPESPDAAQQKATAPAALFNGVVGRRRAVSWSTVSLDDVKRLKNALSVTVNDVILAITSGALRTYLGERNALPDESLIAAVPVDMRASDDKAIGNQVSELPIRWSTDIEDPLERLLTIHQNASAVKAAAHDGESFDFIGMMSEAMLPGALTLLMRGAAAVADKVPLPGNAVVSNVRMTPFPLYCAGARIEKIVPVSMLAPTQGMNITVVSYCGALHFGIVHDPELLPDPWELSGLMPKSLNVLQAALDRKLAAEPV
ncbi:MAG: hypothetical protein CL908_09280 [Deltaproteobacteria bacterium]|jgi:WS/DGAT/MGAT family acyltransferase|nr:hypothetical protein [Deltaproteobacteria bacterium]